MSETTTARLADETSTDDRAIVQTRELNAPRELVFKVWTDPKHIDQWWGPKGFQNETLSMDFRVGGAWRYLMRSAEHGNFPNKIVFEEIVEPERLVYAHGADDDGPAHFHVTVTFEDLGGMTRLTMRSVFPTVEARDHVVKVYGAIEGGKQTLDRLEAHLAALQSA